MRGPVEHRGLNQVRHLIEDVLGWVWRPIDRRDYGLDAYLEMGDAIGQVYRGYGALLGLQVKSGPSHFSGEGTSLCLHLDDPRWKDYWSDSSIPVIVAAYRPETELVHWVDAADFRLTRSGKELVARLEPDSVLGEQSRARLMLMATPAHLLRSHPGGVAAVAELMRTLASHPVDQKLDAKVRRLLFQLQNVALSSKGHTKKSLLAVDTTLDDFGLTAWSNDESYRRSLRALLRASETFRIGPSIQQIYSVRTATADAAKQAMILELAKAQVRLGIRVGVVRREDLRAGLDRDFAVVNGQFVLECTVAQWSTSVPHFSRSAVAMYQEVFRLIEKQALWLNDHPLRSIPGRISGYLR